MAQSGARVTGDFNDLIKNAENAAKSIANLASKITGIAAAAKAFDVATAAIGGTVNALGRIGQAALGLEAIGRSATAMGMGLLAGNAKLEMVTISFKTLLGSAQAADQMIRDLTTFAANTPFNLPGLEQATQRLLGAGYAAKDIVPMMTALGDSIAALGGTQDQLNSLVYVFGQMRNEAHLNAGDIMQMSNLGIPALQMLADHYKVTTAEIQIMISKGLIPGQEAAAIFAEEMEKKYGGMMAAQSKTFSGMISNLQDWATATMIILTKPFFEPAKKALQALLDFVQSPAGIAAINHLAADIQLGVDKITAAFVRFEPQIKPLFNRLLQVAETVRGQVTPSITALIPEIENLWNKVEPLALSFFKLYQSVSPVVTILDVLRAGLSGGLTAAITELENRLKNVPVLLNQVVGQLGKVFGVNLTRPFNDLLLVFNSLVANMRGTVLPAFEVMARFLASNFMPLFDRLSAFTARTLIPVFVSLAAFTMQVLVPAFVRLVDVLGLAFGPALTVIGKIITTELIPNLTRLWDIFDSKYLPTVRKLATEFGERLATNIQLADNRFKAAIPSIEVFLQKIEPVVKALFDFYLAITPVGIALTALQGYLTGGVAGALDALKERFSKIAEYARIGFNFALEEARKFGPKLLAWVEAEIPILARGLLRWTDILAGWIVPAIPGIIRSLEQVGDAIVKWGVNRLPTIIGEIVVGIGDGLGVNLRRPINDILKIFNSLVFSIKNTVLPAFLQMVRFLSTDAMPIIDRLANFISRTVIPTFASLAGFMMTTVVPIFVRAADLFGLVFGPSLTLIGSIIRNELLPALTDSWNYFDGKYMPTVRDLASALGDKLADGIRTATDKFELAIPKLEEFYKKIEPIVGKAIDLYKAISPISIALDILKGFLEGGLQGGFGALEQHVVDLGKVFGLDLQPVIDWFNSTIVKEVIPNLQKWAKTFIDEWWPHIRDAIVFVWDKLQKFWDFVSTVIWPPFSKFLGFLGDKFGEVGKSIGDTWENTIKPALTKFWDYVTNTLWPKLRDDVFPWIEKNVKPKLETAFEVLTKTIIPNLGTMVDIILNKVIPTLVAWWGVLFSLINPFLTTAGNLVDGIGKAMGRFSSTARTNKDDLDGLIGTFRTLLGMADKITGFFHTIWFYSGGWVVELFANNIGGLGGVADLAKGIGAIMNPGQAALEQYMKDHPNYDPVAAGNAPKKAGGDSYWRGGLVEVGDQGMELIRTASNKLLLATQPMLMNLGRGSQIYSNAQTRAMLPNPASPAQIHNMYQGASNNNYSNSNTNNFTLAAQLPVDLSNALQRYYNQQVFKYGK